MEDYITYEDLVDAYIECRRNKRTKESSIEFEIDWEYNLIRLYDEIMNRKYEIGTSITFVTTHPKKREIFASSFRDRIVHHLVCRRLEPLFEDYFIHDTYNCRKGKGTYHGIIRLYEQIYEVSEGYTKDCYVAKFDMKGFFMSIHKPTLWCMLKKFIEERYFGYDKDVILYLMEKIVLHCPEKNCIRKMPKSMWNDIPDDKSLFTNGDEYGLPIGNLTSQMLANFYLTDFDLLMNDKFAYGRYVDDFYVISQNKKEIMKFIPEMRKELAKVKVLLNPKKIYIQHYSKGVSFIGAVVKLDRIYVGSRTVHNFEISVEKFNKIEDKLSNLEHVVSSINSYLGYMIHFKSYNIRRRVLSSLDPSWLEYLFISDDYGKVSIKEKYKLSNIIENELDSANGVDNEFLFW